MMVNFSLSGFVEFLKRQYAHHVGNAAIVSSLCL